MLVVTTQTGSVYWIKNGRITRHPSQKVNWVEHDIDNDIFTFKQPLEVGKPLNVHIMDKGPLYTSPVVTIEKDSV